MKHGDNYSLKLEITFLNYCPTKETQKQECILNNGLFKMGLLFGGKNKQKINKQTKNHQQNVYS